MQTAMEQLGREIGRQASIDLAGRSFGALAALDPEGRASVRDTTPDEKSR